MSNLHKTKILITGNPGVGKTTAIQKVCEVLKAKHNIPMCGFYTEELRSGRQRQGFDVVTLTGQRSPLARKSELVPPAQRNSSPKVGQYCVDVTSFEALALDTLNKPGCELVVIDEIGKMEHFSSRFCQAVCTTFDQSQCAILATIPIEGKLKFADQLRRREDVTVVDVTKDNRDGIVDKVLDILIVN